MARIPEHEVERLKAEVSVERLAEARGIKLERRGADLFGLCPFHLDKNPSLVITPSKNLWHCLGCGKGGSVIDWVEKCHGVSFRHAIELLRANHPAHREVSVIGGGAGALAGGGREVARSALPIKSALYRKRPSVTALAKLSERLKETLQEQAPRQPASLAR
jgi:hypothetical protein